jgi:hypothetical protein
MTSLVGFNFKDSKDYYDLNTNEVSTDIESQDQDENVSYLLNYRRYWYYYCEQFVVPFLLL